VLFEEVLMDGAKQAVHDGLRTIITVYSQAEGEIERQAVRTGVIL
jgi:hypothetical protein